MTIGYAYRGGNIIVIVDYIYNYYDPPYEPFKVDGKIIDMYNMLNPNQKYFRIGSQKNKYIMHTDTPNPIYIFRSFDELKKYHNISDEINLNISGICRTYHAKRNSDKICEEYFHNNYIKEGVYKKYYENSKLEIEANYVNGILNGEYKKYLPNGKPHIEATYNNGNLHGIYKNYHTAQENDYTECYY